MAVNQDWVTAEAPSNIALIKYMGKTEASANRPANASVSYTLDHLRTRVRVRFESGHPKPWIWRPLEAEGFHAPNLSVKGQERFLRHAERCAKRLEVRGEGSLVVESANGFPSDCGLASSASSFAALTLAIAKLAGRDLENPAFRLELAELSREGSGSSCRSLFSPWSVWRAEGAAPIQGWPTSIRHLSLIVDDRKKQVSSSDAHVRVTTSLLFRGRVERAEERLRLLDDQMKRASGVDGVHAWNRAAQLVWAESWDMHALFESSEPPFGYFVPNSVLALNSIREISDEMKSESEKYREPMVTMDAGPNVHVLLWNGDAGAAADAEKFVMTLRERLGSSVDVIDSKGFKT